MHLQNKSSALSAGCGVHGGVVGTVGRASALTSLTGMVKMSHHTKTTTPHKAGTYIILIIIFCARAKIMAKKTRLHVSACCFYIFRCRRRKRARDISERKHAPSHPFPRTEQTMLHAPCQPVGYPPQNVCRNLSKCRSRPPVSSAFTVSSGFQNWLPLGGGISFAGTPTAV